jgi:hypothetical protein
MGDRKSNGFTDEDRAATKERARALRADVRRGPRGEERQGRANGSAPVPGSRPTLG